MEEEQKYYYWLFTFETQRNKGGIIINTLGRTVSKPIIKRARESLQDKSGINYETALLISVSYLGHMTEKEFNGEE